MANLVENRSEKKDCGVSESPSLLNMCNSSLSTAGKIITQCIETSVHSKQEEKYLQLSNFLKNVKQYYFAENFAIKAIKADPGCREAYMSLGRIFRHVGRSADADVCQRSKLPEGTIKKYFSCDSEFVDSDKFESESVRRLVAYPSVSRTLVPAKQLNDEVVEKLSKTNIQSNQTYTVRIEKGRLWIDGLNVVVWDEAGRLIKDLCHGNSEIVNAVAAKKVPELIHSRVALLSDRSANNYYHWMNDLLPRLAVLRESGVDLQSIDRFVVRSLRKPFQKETLASFDIKGERLIRNLEQTYIQADELFIPVHDSVLGEKQDKWALNFLKNHFQPSKSNVLANKRLYLSRGNSGRRGVVNEDEVVAVLSDLDFEIVKTEKMTVKEQVDLFSTASVIVGPHGAGFTNTVFCNPGAKVIELFGRHMEPCFWIASELMGHEHYVYHCNHIEATDPHPVANVAMRWECIQVDVEKLKAILEVADVR